MRLPYPLLCMASTDASHLEHHNPSFSKIKFFKLGKTTPGGYTPFNPVGVNFSGGKYGGMGVYTVVGRVRPRASGWVGVRRRARARMTL